MSNRNSYVTYTYSSNGGEVRYVPRYDIIGNHELFQCKHNTPKREWLQNYLPLLTGDADPGIGYA